MAVIVCQTKYHQTLIFISLVPSLQFGKGIATGSAPGRPEIQQHYFPAQLRKPGWLLVYPFGADDLWRVGGFAAASSFLQQLEEICRRIQMGQTYPGHLI